MCVYVHTLIITKMSYSQRTSTQKPACVLVFGLVVSSKSKQLELFVVTNERMYEMHLSVKINKKDWGKKSRLNAESHISRTFVTKKKAFIFFVKIF